MNMPTPIAFSPGSVTCFFVPSVGASVEDSSSAGCGINLSEGVTAALRPASRITIRLNGTVLDFPTVRTVVELLSPEPVEVFLETPLPLGCGFGVSAAGALTTALALARRFGLAKTLHELGTIALQAEIKHRTGIGDVSTQLCGGVVWRRWRSGPFDCSPLPIPPTSTYYKVFGPLSTRAILGNPQQVHLLAQEGKQALDWLEKKQAEITLAELLTRSLEFARKTGLVTDDRVNRALAEVDRRKGRATMVMLGQSVLATQPGDDPADWHSCNIDPKGTRYLT